MKRNLLAVAGTFLAFFISIAATKAQSKTLIVGFKTEPPKGWITINNSSPAGTFSWFHGHHQPFKSASGDKSYIACNYQAVDSLGTISAWLITPTLILQNGGTISFLTRTVSGSAFPDRLEVRLNTADTTTNVGIADTSVSSFSNLLLSVNPNLQVGGYPDTGWVKYTITLSGLAAIDTGRLAFRYFVTDGGIKGTNSNFIGIDSFAYRAGALPVTFISFDGIIQNNQSILHWSTATETNNKGFDVEKSTDGQIFSSIGFVQGNGTTSFVSNYAFADAKLVSGNNYYRLKQIDLDGNYNYSSTIKLAFGKFDFSILGNGSANPWMQLQLDKQATVAVQIISIDGKIMQEINKGILQQGTYSIPVTLNNMAQGMYIVKVMVNGQVYSKNILKN